MLRAEILQAGCQCCRREDGSPSYILRGDADPEKIGAQADEMACGVKFAAANSRAVFHSIDPGTARALELLGVPLRDTTHVFFAAQPIHGGDPITWEDSFANVEGNPIMALSGQVVTGEQIGWPDGGRLYRLSIS